MMHICGANFQEHCFNISRDIFHSVFYHFLVANLMTSSVINVHITKMSISPKRKKVFRKEKCHSSVFRNAFQISRKYFSCHIHFKRYTYVRTFIALFLLQIRGFLLHFPIIHKSPKRMV